MVKRSRDQSARGAQPAQLLDDGAAGFVLPLPDRFEEFLAAHRDAALLALGQLAFDDQLGGDAGMVGARLPQHVLAAHALEAGQDVLQRVVEGVADMQPPGDVGRRDHDAEGLGVRPASGAECAGLFPLGVNAPFDVLGTESLVEHDGNLLDAGFDEPGRPGQARTVSSGGRSGAIRTERDRISAWCRAPLRRVRLRCVPRLRAVPGSARPSIRG